MSDDEKSLDSEFGPSMVSSTTQTGEPSKRSIRVQTWKKIQDAKVGAGFHATFNRIPPFSGANKAAQLLSETEEFRSANRIKVNIDRALYEVKLRTLLANKTLYLPTTLDSSAVFFEVNVPPASTDDQKRHILRGNDMSNMRTEIGIEDVGGIMLDMVVIGSVAVSMDGHRIGRGNGLTDLDIGMLIELGVVTDETVIATIVHDVQVVESMPLSLFEKFDVPVDMIVTPTRVICVNNLLPRPDGLYWDLVSRSHLKVKRVLIRLKELREQETNSLIELQEEDPSIENFQYRRRRERKRNVNPDQDRSSRRRSGYYRGRHRYQKSHEFQSEDRRTEDSDSDRRRQRRRNRTNQDICIRLTNLTREIRVKDLKIELRKRECNPIAITWKGQYGKCFLHFGNRNGRPSTQEDVDKILTALSDLTLTISTNTAKSSSTDGEFDGKGDEQRIHEKIIPINVKLIKFANKADQINVEVEIDDKPSTSSGLSMQTSSDVVDSYY